MYGRNLNAYKRTKLDAQMNVANPYRIIQMLYEGLLERLSQAKGAIEQKNYEYKADRINKAVGIINGLQSSLDGNESPELAARLSGLYDYMKRLLNKAMISLDPAAIDEVIKLVTPLKEAWDKIPEEVRNRANAEILAKKGG